MARAQGCIQQFELSTRSRQSTAQRNVRGKNRNVKSLLDAMTDGREYQSLVNCVPRELNLTEEIRRGLAEIEAVRGRPALLYAGNLAATHASPHIGLTNHDELPFAEMVDAIPHTVENVDVMVVTPGGSAQTVSYFVDKLRSRFDHVAFLIPYACMSAGTILVLSGDEIWMDERAYLGPIDPQVLGREGRFVPLQALWVLLKKIQEEGRAALAAGDQPAWTHFQLLRNMDAKELGDALSASRYSVQLAAGYLERWKFRNWTVRETSGIRVSAHDRRARAEEIADQLCNHDLWKMHSHRLPRDVVAQDLRLRVRKCESLQGLGRAMRRLWALLYYTFENTRIAKVILSQQYALFRQSAEASK